MSVTIKLLTLVVMGLTAVSSYAAEKKQVNLKAHRVAKVQTTMPAKSVENKNTDMLDLTVEDASTSQDAMDTMEFHSQLPSDLETEKK